MKQPISTFTKFVNEAFKKPLAPTLKELENLESFQRLCKISKIIGSPDLPKWILTDAGGRHLVMPTDWKVWPKWWAFRPKQGTIVTADKYTGSQNVDYSTELDWNELIDWVILKCITSVVWNFSGFDFDVVRFDRSLRGGNLKYMIIHLGVGIGDPYDFGKLRSLLELVYKPISDREMILALSGAPVKLIRINNSNEEAAHPKI